MDDITHSDFWEHLAGEIEPVMQIGESLINVTLPLIEKYNVDLNSVENWEHLPVDFQNELRSCIIFMAKEIPNNTTLNKLLQAETLYLSVFETLEIQYARLDKKDTSTRILILHLMEEVMKGSIKFHAMQLSTWHELFQRRKEASQIENAGEYVYKKVYAALQPKEKMKIYDFFYNKTSSVEIEKLLEEVKKSLLLASTHREQTKKRGQGMSRFIVDYIHYWQDTGLMKPLKSVYPFCQCLQQYWNDEINLGTRQGLEATYKQKL